VSDDAESREESALFSRLPGDEGAREELLLRHRPLALHLARRFAGRGEPIEDLEQVASLALLNAIDRFDPSRDVRFSTFATVTIVGELKRHLRDKGWAVRVPRSLQELAVRVNAVLPELAQELGRSPTVPEIAERVGATQDDVVDALDASRAYSTDSLDAPVGEGETTAGESLGGHDARFERLEAWASIAPAIDRLPERERTILFLRFFEERSQGQIAETLGISQMHVSRLLAKVLAGLREDLSA
jgi:RNA polymerase sigma-B factor